MSGQTGSDEEQSRFLSLFVLFRTLGELFKFAQSRSGHGWATLEAIHIYPKKKKKKKKEERNGRWSICMIRTSTWECELQSPTMGDLVSVRAFLIRYKRCKT